VTTEVDAREPAMAHSEGLFLWAGDTLLPYGTEAMRRGDGFCREPLAAVGRLMVAGSRAVTSAVERRTGRKGMSALAEAITSQGAD
jgi:hypothetical protein